MKELKVNDREQLISQSLDPYCPIYVLPLDPSVNDLKKYSRINLKKHRNLRKFLKEPTKYIRKEIGREYRYKIMARIMSEPIRKALNYNSLFMVEEMSLIDSKNITGIHFKPDQTIRNLYGTVYSRECFEAIANSYSNVTLTNNTLEAEFKIEKKNE